MAYGCGCLACEIIGEWHSVQDSLSCIDCYGCDGPCTYYKYPDDDAKEIAYQRGRRAGLEFRYNELKGYKAL